MKESVVYINIITKYGCPQISYKQKIVLAPISLSNSAIFFTPKTPPIITKVNTKKCIFCMTSFVFGCDIFF